MLIADSLFKGSKVILNGLFEDDLQTLAEWQGQEESIRRYDAVPIRYKRREDWAEWLKDTGPDKFRFAIRSIENNKLVGYIELEGILWNHRVSWVSIIIGDEESRGKGFGKEAMEMIMAYAFRELNLHRLQLTVFSYNTNAIALYERLGFKKEGVYREFLERDFMRHDMFLYGLLREEWLSINRK